MTESDTDPAMAKEQKFWHELTVSHYERSVVVEVLSENPIMMNKLQHFLEFQQILMPARLEFKPFATINQNIKFWFA